MLLDETNFQDKFRKYDWTSEPKDSHNNKSKALLEL